MQPDGTQFIVHKMFIVTQLLEALQIHDEMGMYSKWQKNINHKYMKPQNLLEIWNLLKIRIPSVTSYSYIATPGLPQLAGLYVVPNLFNQPCVVHIKHPVSSQDLRRWRTGNKA